MERSISLRLFSLLVLICLCLVPNASTRAQADGLNEPFNDPALPGWQRNPPAQVVNGLIRIQKNGYAFHPGDWQDFTLTLRARLDGVGFIGIKVRSSDHASYGYFMSYEGMGLQREAGGQVEVLDETSTSFQPVAWSTIKIISSRHQQQLIVNGQLMLQAVDLNPLPPGGVMLTAGGEAAGEFDDLILIPAGNAPPGSATPAQTAGQPPTAMPLLSTQPTAGITSVTPESPTTPSQQTPASPQTVETSGVSPSEQPTQPASPTGLEPSPPPPSPTLLSAPAQPEGSLCSVGGVLGIALIVAAFLLGKGFRKK